MCVGGGGGRGGGGRGVNRIRILLIEIPLQTEVRQNIYTFVPKL